MNKQTRKIVLAVQFLLVFLTACQAERIMNSNRTAKANPIDRILEEMDWGTIAFNTPETMSLEETRQIQLVLGPAQTRDQLERMIRAAGKVQSEEIKISDEMEANLSGSDFEITKVTPEKQAISRQEVTEWKWDVKAVQSGNHRLHLTLNVILQIEGDKVPRAIRTFSKEINVHVTWSQSISRFVSNHWEWLGATLVIPLATWLWSRRRKNSTRNE